MNCRSIMFAGALALGVIGIYSTFGPPPVAAQSAARQAVSRTATFSIANMTCALCPLTVRTAIERVSGVQSVEVDFDSKTATVTFDPSVTDAKAIAAASANAGYPAKLSG